MHGYKTFAIALVMLSLATFALYNKMIEATDFMKIFSFVCGMVGLREVSDKLLTKE